MVCYCGLSLQPRPDGLVPGSVEQGAPTAIPGGGRTSEATPLIGGAVGLSTSLMPERSRYVVGEIWTYTRNDEVVEIVSVEPPIPGDDDTYLSVRFPNADIRETCGSMLGAPPGGETFTFE